MNEDECRRRNHEHWKLESFLGKPVMYFSNEVQPPLVGFGKQLELITQAKQPVLIIEDYLTDQDMMAMGRIRHYTEQLLTAAFTVEPNTLIALLYPVYDAVEVDKKPLGKQYTLMEARRVLTDRGFYERLQTYRLANTLVQY